MKKVMAVFALVLGFTSVSQAGLLLEPYLSYEMGTMSGAQDGKTSGTGLGARIGWTAPVMFWAALDGSTGTVTSKPDVGADDDGKRTSLYATVGVDFPILVRGWLGYGLMNEVSFDTAGKVKGKATKIGIGFTGLPFVSLNVEMIKETFDDADGATMDPTLDNSATVLSVSLPLDL
ncbi:hypothetical protein [Bdellovibrio reynosensis]|uniref:Outer membrane protein beta-barrel domain-containing protein n=1 Tax=Bdellovibrio reynosensis TaxID=2835041 RepID=A0ABY4CD14_9BACT|nr:hypothetical protein [Bdellovibrio reynosensis]UOF01423.1 hypothetical protein MNR06_00460 [Bdellovibrio reynosensis]